MNTFRSQLAQILLATALLGCGTASQNAGPPRESTGETRADPPVSHREDEAVAQSPKPTPTPKPGEDWRMYGRDATRNPVSPERGAPIDWDVESGRNIKWSAPLGTMTLGDPVVADGMIWVGTSREEKTGDFSVLKCFRESDGELLYEYASPRHPDRHVDIPGGSMPSAPVLEDDRIWFVTNRWEVVCLDIGPLNRRTGLPKEVWKFDLIDELGVYVRVPIMGIVRGCSPVLHKDRLFVVTGNGTEHLGSDVVSPRSPSLICLSKGTGRLLWEDDSPWDQILDAQWT
ncbi:MAG: PQQ-like beta-propeller repeat protein, partial [Planctomycetales bacterium]